MMVFSVFAMHLGFGSERFNDNTPEELAEAQFLASIEYIEEEDCDDFDLGFNTYEYLPLDFDPYQEMILNFNDIEFIESDEEFEL